MEITLQNQESNEEKTNNHDASHEEATNKKEIANTERPEEEAKEEVRVHSDCNQQDPNQD